MAANAGNQIFHRLFQLRFRHEAIHHAEFQGALRRYRFARQNKLKRDLRSDEVWQNCGCQRRADAVALTGKSDSPGDFAEHGFIEKIMFRTAEGHSRDAGFDAELHMLKFFRFAPFRLRGEILGVDRLNHFPRSWASIAFFDLKKSLEQAKSDASTA